MKYMNDYFEDLVSGLNQAIEYERNKTSARERHIIIKPVIKYSGKDVKRIRNKSKMTQKILAAYMGVSVKTVEAWETGTNHPSGSACRLLSILDAGTPTEFYSVI